MDIYEEWTLSKRKNNFLYATDKLRNAHERISIKWFIISDFYKEEEENDGNVSDRLKHCTQRNIWNIAAILALKHFQSHSFAF